MFKKITLKVKESFKNYLGINNIENKIDNVHSDLKNYVNTTANAVKRQSQDIDYNSESIRLLHSTIENVVHIGTDVRQFPNNREHSWAVVCIEGKINIVKFVDLDRKDAREVLDFLKHFEGGRNCIDVPNKEMFYDGLFKF